MTNKRICLISIPNWRSSTRSTKPTTREQLQWLADRGLCSWSEAVEYFAGPLVPQPEYKRITRNYGPVNCGARFTVG